MSSLIDVYLGSNELKKLIVNRSEELRLPLRFICHRVKIDYSVFIESYINSLNNHTFDITEKQFEQILGQL
jgi:hypothetical protein